MSVTTETNRVDFVGDGNDNSPYAIPFPLRDDESVEIIYITIATGAEASKTIVTDYAIALAADFTTASLTLVTTAPATGEIMRVRRDEPATRLSSYSNFDGQPASTLNSDYDKSTMSDITLREQLDRAILVSKGHPNANLPLTPLNLIGNAGRNVVVNSSETGFELVAASGFALTGSGTLNTIPLWTPDGLTLGDSVMTQFGVSIRVASGSNFELAGGDLQVFGQISCTGQIVTAGNLNVDGGIIRSTTGAISFDNENLSTTGTVATGILTSNSDADGTTILGRAKIGSIGADTMYLAHFDRLTATDFALLQTATGATTLNAVIGQNVNLSVNNSIQLSVQPTRVNIPSLDLDLGLGDITVTAGDVVVTAGDVVITAGSLGIGTSLPEQLIHAKATNTPSRFVQERLDSSVAVGNVIGGWQIHAGESDSTVTVGSAEFEADETWGAASSGTRYLISLAPSGSTSAVEVFRISMNGDTDIQLGDLTVVAGDLGVGTTPLTDVHVDMKAPATITTLAGSVFLEAFANAGAGNLGAGIILGRADGGRAANHGAAIVSYQDTGDANTTGIILYTHPAAGASARVPAMRLDSSQNVAVGNITPTIKLDVNAKSGYTDIGGVAVKLTNKTGGNTVAGQLVIASTVTADAFDTALTNDDRVIGIVLDTGVADGSEAWIIHGGFAMVLMDAGGAALGDRIVSSATAGSGDVNNGPATGVHFQEVGHSVGTTGGGGLVKCAIHLN